MVRASGRHARGTPSRTDSAISPVAVPDPNEQNRSAVSARGSGPKTCGWRREASFSVIPYTTGIESNQILPSSAAICASRALPAETGRPSEFFYQARVVPRIDGFETYERLSSV